MTDNKQPEKPKAANPYELFKTDGDLETKGVVLNYGGFKITVARAGGANKKYSKVFEAKIRPHRRAIANGTLDETTDRQVMAEVYADAVVLGWEGVTDKEGDEMPFTKANVVKLFTDLPDLFVDVIQQANTVSVFRQDELEVDAKN